MTGTPDPDEIAEQLRARGQRIDEYEPTPEATAAMRELLTSTPAMYAAVPAYLRFLALVATHPDEGRQLPGPESFGLLMGLTLARRHPEIAMAMHALMTAGSTIPSLEYGRQWGELVDQADFIAGVTERIERRDVAGGEPPPTDRERRS